VDTVVSNELLSIYGYSRTDAFKSGVAFLVFVAIVGLILTSGLPDKRLVGGDNEQEDTKAQTVAKAEESS